jgi:hypothetical protein
VDAKLENLQNDLLFRVCKWKNPASGASYSMTISGWCIVLTWV